MDHVRRALRGASMLWLAAAVGCGGISGSSADFDAVYVRCTNKTDPDAGNGFWQLKQGEAECGSGVSKCAKFFTPNEIGVCLNDEDGYVVGTPPEDQLDLILQACADKCDRDYHGLRLLDPITG